jgi:hydrogenase 3 maturation protease
MNDLEDNRVAHLIMCIGNIDGGDDAIGPYIADKLMQEEGDLVVLNCGTVPENFTSVVKQHNPKNLIIVDAVEMGLDAGKIRIVPKEKIGVMHISTHGIPIPVLISYLEQYVKNITFIGIQPETMSGEISENVKKSGERLVKIIKNNSLGQIKILQGQE